ncbi:MAG: hypothetical protein HZA95_01065 [Candidatus Vogelbacteria bacterium]|nr:hypothetical protein [Candidatus Vogelbacteria bacterium]
MGEAQKLEQRLVRFLACLVRDSYLPPAIILGSMLHLIVLSAVRLFGGDMFAILGRRGKGKERARLTPRLRAAAEGALASIHHPNANLEEDGVVARALRELIECVAEEYPLTARHAVKDFLRAQYTRDVDLFHVCGHDLCWEEAENYYCARHCKEADEEERESDARLTPEERAEMEQDVEARAEESERFEEEIRRRFSKRRVD